MTDKTPFSVETPDESSGFLLWQVSTLWQRGLKKQLEAFDLTHPQFVLLASTLWLTQAGMEITQISLSQHTKIDPMTTSVVVRTLIQKGLMQRTPHPTDTRANLVRVTPAAETLLQAAIPAVENFDSTFFARLGTSVSDFNRLLNELTSME